MTIWIERRNNEFSDDSMFAAWMGFRWRGQIIQFYPKPQKIDYKPGDVVVGDLQSVNYMLKKLEVPIPNMYIPEGLEEFAGRKIEQCTVGDVLVKCNSQNIKMFMKPVTTKEFPAQVVEPNSCLITFPEQNLGSSLNCWCSDIVNFVSEYRVFMKNAEPLGCHIYLGDWKKQLDWSVIDKAVDILKPKQTPSGWSLDWGVTDDGRTLLIEANDGFSLGHYGFDCIEYSQLLHRRWNELVNGRE
jgi:hypothetical protein